MSVFLPDKLEERSNEIVFWLGMAAQATMLNLLEY